MIFQAWSQFDLLKNQAIFLRTACGETLFLGAKKKKNHPSQDELFEPPTHHKRSVGVGGGDGARMSGANQARACQAQQINQFCDNPGKSKQLAQRRRPWPWLYGCVCLWNGSLIDRAYVMLRDDDDDDADKMERVGTCPFPLTAGKQLFMLDFSFLLFAYYLGSRSSKFSQ